MKEVKKKKPIFRGDETDQVDKRSLYPYFDCVSNYTLFCNEQPSFVESKIISALNSEDIGFGQSKSKFKLNFVMIDDHEDREEETET